MVESEAPRPASSSLGESKGGAKVRFVWFKITQLLLLIYLLFLACSLVYVQSSRSLSQAFYAGYLPGILELVLVVLTVVPQAVICALHRQRPQKWLWIDFGIGLVQLCLCVVLLWDLPGKEAESITAIESALLLAVAVRMYVRQVVHSDIAHAKWHELHVGRAQPRVSSFGIMWKGTKLLLIECPGTQARYLVSAILAAAQPPVVSTLVSIAVSTPQGKLNVTVAALSVLGAIAVGQLALVAMSESTARMTQIGSVALQRRLAENAVYSADLNTGRLTSTFAQGIAKMQSLWTMVYWSLVFSVLQLALNLGFMCSVDYVIAIVALAGLQLIFLVQGLKLKADRFSKEYAKALAQQQTMLENLISLRTAARTRRAGWWLLERWDVLAHSSGTTLYLSQLFSNLFNSSFQAMGYGVYVFLLGGIYIRYNQGVFTQQQTFASVGYLLGIVGPINALGSFSSRVIWSAGPILNVYTLTAKVEPGDSKPDTAHGARPSARHLLRRLISPTYMISRNSSAGAGTYATSGDVKGPRVVIEKLVFQYSGANAPTLKGVSGEVNCGEFVALVGGSGSGKTTLLKLLGRANNDDVAACNNSGSVTVDGVPADDYLQTAFCTQSFDVLNGTVRDNITFGCACDSDEDVRRAASLAGLAHVIQAMPQGYDTVIGRGSSVSLSGGQLARLGLARALCCRPRLLLLDEVTSALDPETQQQVLDSLHALRRETPITIVLCTHSVKAAEAAGRVIVLAEGVIAETGSFAELVARRGAFFTLARAHLDAADTDLPSAAHVAVPIPACDAGLREERGPPRDVAGSNAPGIALHAAPAAAAPP